MTNQAQNPNLKRETGEILEATLGEGRVEGEVSMAGKTYFRLGGPADFYFEAKTAEEVVAAVTVCRKNKIPYFVMGLGANLLVGDRGVRGLVIKVANREVEVVGSYRGGQGLEKKRVGEHYRPFDTAQYLRFDDLEGEEPPPDTLVRVGAGVTLAHLIDWTLAQTLVGLQYFAGIPSTVGGCIYNNVHGGTKLFDQFVEKVVLLDKEGQVKEALHDEMEFAYDYSRLQRTGEIVLEVYLKLAHGDVARARQVRGEWLRRKIKVQPQINCSGCIFKNLSEEEKKRIGAPTNSAGWVLDQLGLKGTKIGGVEISQKHANFFVNDGTGKAADVLALIKLAKDKARERFGVELQEEIQRVGEF
jgi:UDP-N-acetylmuramate dehydrogenase